MSSLSLFIINFFWISLLWMSGARISFERADANCRTPTINGRSYELSTVSVCAPFLRTSHCCRSSMCPIMMRASVLSTVRFNCLTALRCSIIRASMLSMSADSACSVSSRLTAFHHQCCYIILSVLSLLVDILLIGDSESAPFLHAPVLRTVGV